MHERPVAAEGRVAGVVVVGAMPAKGIVEIREVVRQRHPRGTKTTAKEAAKKVMEAGNAENTLFPLPQ